MNDDHPVSYNNVVWIVGPSQLEKELLDGSVRNKVVVVFPVIDFAFSRKFNINLVQS